MQMKGAIALCSLCSSGVFLWVICKVTVGVFLQKEKMVFAKYIPACKGIVFILPLTELPLEFCQIGTECGHSSFLEDFKERVGTPWLGMIWSDSLLLIDQMLVWRPYEHPPQILHSLKVSTALREGSLVGSHLCFSSSQAATGNCVRLTGGPASACVLECTT